MPVCCYSLAGTAACLTCPNRQVLPNPVMWHETNIPSQKGWECPVCGMVMAPWMPNCTKCPVQTTWTTSAEPPAPPKEASKVEVVCLTKSCKHRKKCRHAKPHICDGKQDCVLGVMQQDKCDIAADWKCAYCGKDCRQNICLGRANSLRKD